MSARITLLAASLLASVQLPAAIPIETVIPASDITLSASTVFSPPQAAVNLINGSGLSGERHDPESGAKTMWHTVEHPAVSTVAGVRSPAWVRFDFTKPQAVNRIAIWNHNQANLTNRGFRKTRILGTADGSTWRTVAELELKQGGDTAQNIGFSGKEPMKAVVIAAESNWGGNVYGLSETQFIASKDVAEADLPFPSEMECKPQPHYGHRPDGKPGREVTIGFGGAKLYGESSISVAVNGKTETTELPAAVGGIASARVLLPDGVAVTNDATVTLTLRRGSKTLTRELVVPHKRQWTVYVYPHSHVDIGYTEAQEVVEKIHMRNLDVGLELGRATAAYPEGARHVWNNEVLWAVESWVKQATPEKKQEFVDAVKNGRIGLSASYAHLNTTAASDEELLRFFACARRMRQLTGAPIDTMCQFDIPGMSWGIVPAAAQNGVRAILDFPNPSDRTGNIHTWRNRHFRWVGPDGKSKVLYLQIFPYNLAWKLGAFNMNPKPFVQVPGRDRFDFANSPLMGTGDLRPGPTLADFLRVETENLERAGSPYDIYPIAWSLSDNAMVDCGLPDFVRKWNEQYAFPKLVIASAATIADAFEKRFGEIIPEHRGDLTEYWTDGLGSDARRVGYNRVAKENLVQAETLWTMLRRQDAFPQSEFYDAWRWIQLGTEHTWGYMMPDQPIAKQIEATKASYFENAGKAGRELLAKSLQPIANPGSDTIAVLNTLSWNRGGLVTISAGESKGVNGIQDAVGRPVPSQRLTSGELVFLAAEAPALGAKTYRLATTPVALTATTMVSGDNSLENSLVKMTLNPQTGDIASLVDKRTGRNFANTNSPYALNSFRHLRGAGAPVTATGPTDVRITIKESGPVVASLLVESKAEGCNKLTREIRLVADQPHVEMLNVVDKISTRAKEGIHFGFAFNVPDATTRMDIPWGVMNPLTDQLPGSNKNWLAFQRWIDVSNDQAGVTWVGLEAAVVEFGDITANILGSGGAWINRLGDTRTILSWALNNHWHTNFPLEQHGVIPFRYAILPHGGYDAVVANRFGLEQNRPLIAVPSSGNPAVSPVVAFDNPRVFLSTLKPADDGQATILRLRSLSDKPETVKLTWPAGQPQSIHHCLADEQPGHAVTRNQVELPPFGAATLRLAN